MIWRILCWKRRKKTARVSESQGRGFYLLEDVGEEFLNCIVSFKVGEREKSFVSFPHFQFQWNGREMLFEAGILLYNEFIR